MIDMTNREQRYIITPAGKGWMFGYDNDKVITVHYAPTGKGSGTNRSYEVSECEEVENG